MARKEVAVPVVEEIPIATKLTNEANDLLEHFIVTAKVKVEGLELGRTMNADTIASLKALQDAVECLYRIGVLKF